MSECNRCGKCCQFFAIRVLDKNQQLDTHTRQFLNTRGWFVHGDYIVTRAACKHLRWEPDGTAKCAIYDRRPLVCKVYPTEFDWKPKGCCL